MKYLYLLLALAGGDAAGMWWSRYAHLVGDGPLAAVSNWPSPAALLGGQGLEQPQLRTALRCDSPGVPARWG